MAYVWEVKFFFSLRRTPQMHTYLTPFLPPPSQAEDGTATVGSKRSLYCRKSAMRYCAGSKQQGGQR